MKIKFGVKFRRGKRVIFCTAKIIKSEKHNIPRTIQKTWAVFTELAQPDDFMKMTFRKQATRWHNSWMQVWFGTPDKFPQQTEIITDEFNAESKQESPMPNLPEAGLVSGGEVSGPVHEGGVDEAKGPVGQ